MAPDLILVVAGLSAAWAVFSIVGSERVRVLQRVELTRRESQAATDTDSKPSTKQPSPAVGAAAKSSK